MLQSQGPAKRSEGGTGTGPLSEASHGPQSHGAVPQGGWRAREVSWEAVWSRLKLCVQDPVRHRAFTGRDEFRRERGWKELVSPVEWHYSST